MLKHIVVFKMAECATADEKQQKILKMKDMLETLPSKIDVIRKFEVGVNVVKSHASFDLALVSEFDNAHDLEVYRVHPAHQEAVVYIRSVTVDRASVDYEF